MKDNSQQQREGVLQRLQRRHAVLQARVSRCGSGVMWETLELEKKENKKNKTKNQMGKSLQNYLSILLLKSHFNSLQFTVQFF